MSAGSSGYQHSCTLRLAITLAFQCVQQNKANNKRGHYLQGMPIYNAVTMQAQMWIKRAVATLRSTSD